VKTRKKKLLLLLKFEVPLTHPLDLGKFLTGAAEPDVHVLALHRDFLGEVGHFEAGIAGGLEGGENLPLQRSSRGALGRAYSGFFCHRDFLGGAPSAFSGCFNSLARDQGGELFLDFFDLTNERFLALRKFDKVAQAC